MPTSNLALAPTVVTLVDQVHPKSVLDVGPGFGKYGILLREYCPSIEQLDACEAWPGYVTDRLRCLYDEVFVQDVLTLSDEVLARYDVLLLSEIIEHLEKADGLALLARIPGHVVITTPETFFDNPPHLPPTERHRSLWALSDFGDRVEEDRSQLGGLVVRLARR